MLQTRSALSVHYAAQVSSERQLVKELTRLWAHASVHVSLEEEYTAYFTRAHYVTVRYLESFTTVAAESTGAD